MRDKALAAIEAADIKPAAYRLARRMLDRVGPNGHLTLTLGGLAQLAGTKGDSGARRHLIALQNAGIIHYSTNANAYVTFLAWPIGLCENRAQDCENRAQDCENRAQDCDFFAGDNSNAKTALRIAKTAHTSAKTALRIAKTAHTSAKTALRIAETAHPKVGWLVDTDPQLDIDQPTNRITAYLTDPDIGLTAADAAEFDGLSEEWIYKHCLVYLRDLDAGTVSNNRVLLTRLRNGWMPSGKGDTNSAFAKRHAPSETDQRRQDYLPDDYADIILG